MMIPPDLLADHDNRHQITPQLISDFDYDLRLKREQLTLFTKPLKTFWLFLQCLVYGIKNLLMQLLFSRISLVLIPLVIVWAIQENFDHAYTKSVNEIEFIVKYIVWWVGLGIASSIGLGSGLQSGLLFLYPHIIKTFAASEKCRSLNFDSMSDMYFNKGGFTCSSSSPITAEVTFYGLWLKIMLPCFLQAAGTAIGEIPPYYMSRSARLIAIEAGLSEALDDVPEEMEDTDHALYNKIKNSLVWFLKAYGGTGVLVAASIPNPLFDVCGVACGHYLMSFPTFFVNTFIGKAIIRNGYQSFLYVLLYDEKYLQLIIVTLQYLAPDEWDIDAKIKEMLEAGKASFQSSISEDAVEPVVANEEGLFANLMRYWQLLVLTLLSLFVLSCVSAIAQYYQLTLDQKSSEVLRNRLPAQVRESITSPKSRRLVLPKPTPRKSSKKTPPPKMSPLPAK